MKLKLLTATSAFVLAAGGANALTISATDDAAALAAALVDGSSGITIVAGSESYQGAADQGGTYSGFSLSNSDDTISIGDGIVLTSGSVDDIQGNDAAAISAFPGAGSDADLNALSDQNVTNDANVLSFDFTADEGVTSIDLSFVFATDEYPNQSVTDIFGVFVDGENYAFLSDGSLVNFELGSPAAAFFRDNDFNGADPYTDASGEGFEYDGIIDKLTLTGLLDLDLDVHTIKIAIGDTSDQSFDSGVFVSGIIGGDETDGGGIDTNPGDGTAVIPVPAGLPLILGALGALGIVRRRKG